LTRLHHVQNWRLVSDYCRTIPSLYWQKSGYQQDALIAQLDAIRPQLVHFRTLSLQWLLSKKKQERTVLDYQYVRFLRYLS
jgi:glutamyl/glutaminyl-tRNA synthetase